MHPTAVARLFKTGAMALAISQLFTGHAWAATEAARIAELEQKLEKSMALIERLSSRLGELEKGGARAPQAAPAAATPAATPAPAAEARIEALERDVAQMAESGTRAAPAASGVPLHGFADVGYASSNQPVADGRKRGFTLGNVDFYLTPEFGGGVKSLLELNFEYGEDGALATDLERLQIGYTFSDAATLWAGRFHTPYGYWNTAFHHGAQIQSSVLRPKMIAFEDQGGILPAHTVGLWATGQTRLGAGKFEYDAYAGNGGRTVDGVLDFNPVKDNNSNIMLGGNVRYRFGDALDGLVLGAHGFSEKVAASGVAERTALASNTQVNMLGGYGFYDGNDWEVIGEYYGFRNKDLSAGSGKHNSWAGFLQVGKSFGGVLPFARVEKAVLDQADNYFLSQNSGLSYQRQALGVRFELGPKAALKVEMNHTDESGNKYNEAQVQAAVRF
jgi:hypothetical protein